MDCDGMTTPGVIVMSSMNSLPGGSVHVAKVSFMRENVPVNVAEPYVTNWQIVFVNRFTLTR